MRDATGRELPPRPGPPGAHHGHDMTSIGELGRLDRDAFVAEVGFAFESSPWVAEAAWEERPFGSVEELHAAMVRAVERAPEERQLALIRAHPELGRRRGRSTPASAAEQAAAGLDRPDGEERARLERAARRLPRALRLPVRRLRARAHPGRHRRRRRGAARPLAGRGAGHGACRDREDRCAGLEDRVGNMIDYEISYGKASVPVFRHFATPLAGRRRCPSPPSAGATTCCSRTRSRWRCSGQLPARLHARRQLERGCHRLDEELHPEPGARLRGRDARGLPGPARSGFLERYEQMHEVRVSGREPPFEAAQVPGRVASMRAGCSVGRSRASTRSRRSLRPRRGRRRAARAAQRAGGDGAAQSEGSAFTRFVRDEYTTLPERSDRPLFILLDVHWSYADPQDALGETPAATSPASRRATCARRSSTSS